MLSTFPNRQHEQKILIHLVGTQAERILCKRIVVRDLFRWVFRLATGNPTIKHEMFLWKPKKALILHILADLSPFDGGTSTYIYIHIHTYAYIYIHIHTYTHIHAYECIGTYKYLHAYEEPVHIFICIHIRTQIHTYMHAYLHSYLDMCLGPGYTNENAHTYKKANIHTDRQAYIHAYMYAYVYVGLLVYMRCLWIRPPRHNRA